MDMFTDRARDDFNRARFKDMVTELLTLMSPEEYELLSLKEVRGLLKPKGEHYEGMKSVPISLIVGSEGRYNDFNKAFLPRHDYLRARWENVDKAHLKEVILPPVKLYEIGGVYFVRDGNHRVSVAKMKGVKYVDAEIISLSSEISLKPYMTKNDLRKAVIEFEKKSFYNETHLELIIHPDELDFTATGQFVEVLVHIHVHKYYLNENRKDEIKLEEAAYSWKKNLFDPIVEAVTEEKILNRFPGRTNADLYVWIIRHWGFLKNKFGEDFTVRDAARDFSERFGKSIWQQFKDLLAHIIYFLRVKFKM